MSDSGIEFCNRDFRAIVAFYYKKNITAKEAHEEINSVLGDNTVSYSFITHWFRLFRCGRRSLEDRPKSGRPLEVTTDKYISIIEDLVRVEPRVTAHQIAE